MFYFFEVIDENMLERIYRFRYDIVCEELGFFDKSLYKDKKEKDKYDKYSTHFVAVNDSFEIVATTRLIHHSPIGYPTTEHLQIDKDIQEFLHLKYESLAEVSRVFIAKKFRNMHDTKYVMTKFIKEKVYFKMKDVGVEYAYSAMEMRLVRLLRMFKIDFKIIGPLQEGYGSPRYPCLLDVKKLEWDNPMLLQHYEERGIW